MAVIHSKVPIIEPSKRKRDISKHEMLVNEGVKILKYGFYIIDTDEQVFNELIYEFKQEHGNEADKELFKKEHEEMKKLSEKLTIPYWIKCNPKTIYTDPQNITNIRPDVIGWRDGKSIVIEAKTSHSDFLNDKKRKNVGTERVGKLGKVGDFFYYLTFPDVIKVNELEEEEGLIYYYPNTIGKGKNICIKKALYKDRGTKDTEIAILLSILRGRNINSRR